MRGVGRILTREFLEKEYVEKGKTAKDIALAIGCHQNIVHQYRRRWKIKPHVVRVKCDVSEDKIVDMYESGMSCPEVAKILNVRTGYIQNIMFLQGKTRTPEQHAHLSMWKRYQSIIDSAALMKERIKGSGWCSYCCERRLKEEIDNSKGKPRCHICGQSLRMKPREKSSYVRVYTSAPRREKLRECKQLLESVTK